MHPTDVRTLLVALRDLLVSASGLVDHLLAAHGGSETIVTPPPAAVLALPVGGRARKTARPARRSKRAAARRPARRTARPARRRRRR